MPTCHSTNDIATDLFKKNKIKEGSVILTENQTAGRGQRGNNWESEPGKNITCSVVFQPSFLEPSENFYLNVFSSLGIIDYLSEMGDHFKIKWPNDIFYKDKKICGMLIENTVKGNLIGNSILGIGFNLNQLHFKVDTAISLANIYEKEFNIYQELENLSVNIENRYLQLKNNDLSGLNQDYSRNLYWLNEKRNFYDQDYFEGTIKGISSMGRLLIEVAGELREYGFKEVRFVAEGEERRAESGELRAESGERRAES